MRPALGIKTALHLPGLGFAKVAEMSLVSASTLGIALVKNAAVTAWACGRQRLSLENGRPGPAAPVRRLVSTRARLPSAVFFAPGVGFFCARGRRGRLSWRKLVKGGRFSWEASFLNGMKSCFGWGDAVLNGVCCCFEWHTLRFEW